MLPEWGADVNTENDAGQSPLCLAAQAGHTHIISLLLHCGASLDTPERLVRAAARGGNTEVVRFVLDTVLDKEDSDDKVETENTEKRKTSRELSRLPTVALVTAAAHRHKEVRSEGEILKY